MIIPHLEPEQLFAVLGDVEQRVKTDPRWVSPRILEKKGESSVLTFETAKPPIPMVSAREVVVECFSRENGFGPGQHAFIQVNTEHAEAPIKNGLGAKVRANCIVAGNKFEKNPTGKGTLVTELRVMQTGGNMPAVMIGKMSTSLPQKSVEANKKMISVAA